MVLLDTSVWLLTFRKHQPLKLETVLPLDEVVTCLPIIQEVLQGFRDERPFRIAHSAMHALPIVEAPLSKDVFEIAVEMCRDARRSGLTLRSSVDCLIAACALRNDLTVLHRDRDFDALSKVSALQARSI